MTRIQKSFGFTCATVFVFLFAFAMIESCRNKGEAEITGKAIETNGLVNLKLQVKNKDRRVELSAFVVYIFGEWQFLALQCPTNAVVTTNVYGPSSKWQSIDVSPPSQTSIGPGEQLEFAVSLLRKPGATTNRIDGNVSYIGAAVWEKVGLGQRNAEYFSVPVKRP